MVPRFIGGGGGGTGLIASAEVLSCHLTHSFSSLQGLTELDSGTHNGDPGLTVDESVIVFASARTGNYDIYLASRPCL